MKALIGLALLLAACIGCNQAPQAPPKTREYTAEEKAYMDGAAKLGPQPTSASSGCNGPGMHRMVAVNGLIDKGVHDLGWLAGVDSFGKAEGGAVFEVPGICSDAEGLAWGIAEAGRMARERGAKLLEPHVVTWVNDDAKIRAEAEESRRRTRDLLESPSSSVQSGDRQELKRLQTENQKFK